MHIPGGVSCILFAAVVQTWEIFLEFLGTSPHMLLSGSLGVVRSHLYLLNKAVHYLLLRVVTINLL